jgi:hypothetical protein
MTLGKDLEKKLLVKSVLVNDYGNGLTIFGGLFWCVGSLESYEAGIRSWWKSCQTLKCWGKPSIVELPKGKLLRNDLELACGFTTIRWSCWVKEPNICSYCKVLIVFNEECQDLYNCRSLGVSSCNTYLRHTHSSTSHLWHCVFVVGHWHFNDL